MERFGKLVYELSVMTHAIPDRPLVPDYLLRVRISMILCMVGFALLLSLNHQLLTLLLKTRGYDETAIGISAAMAPLGILLSSFCIPWLTRQILPAYAAASGLLTAAGCLFFLYLFEDYYIWLFLRFCLGVGINITFIIGEAWVNESAKATQRGKTMAIYMILLSISFAFGPVILSAIGIEGFLPFALGIVIACVSALPILYYRHRYPDFPQAGEYKVSLWKFMPLAPALLFSILIVTMMDQSMLAFLSIYGLSYGLPQEEAVLLVFYFVFGTVLLQYPIGVVADMLPNQRLATLGCAVLAIIGFALIPFSMGHWWLYIPLLVLTGGFSFAVYTLGLTELGNRFSGAYLLAGTACFSMIWGGGGIVAPPIVGALMEHWGNDLLMYFISFVYLILAIMISVRLSRGADVHNA